jgi:transcription initiation factor TFIIH subunit 1
MDLKFPVSLQQKIKNHHGKSNEILRHFWSSFIPYKAEKNKRMVEGLRCQRDKFHEYW